jgi:transcriptional regulator with XRE-family HTH domain
MNSNAQKIRMALAYKRMSEAELARAFGSSPAAFNQRMKTDKFTLEELGKIAAILGAEYIAKIEFPDGVRI